MMTFGCSSTVFISTLFMLIAPGQFTPANHAPSVNGTSIIDNTGPILSLNCGKSERLESRILGGIEADSKSWPWMAVLIDKSSNQTLCGASLISDRYLITAAHCFHWQNLPNKLIRLGARDFSTMIDLNAKDYETERAKNHEEYDSRTHKNDIAVVKLREKVQISEKSGPICLPNSETTLPGKQAVLIGFGDSEYGGSLAKRLKEIELPVLNDTACQSAYNLTFVDKVYRAGYPEGGPDSCHGDGGGPLMVQGAKKRWHLIGIASFGRKCGQRNSPGVYNRVSSYLDWIAQKTVITSSSNEPSRVKTFQIRNKSWSFDSLADSN